MARPRTRDGSAPAAANPVDVEVGRRLREQRTLQGISQERLGELLGITYQQVQKYERGANRIGSSRLYEICRILGVPAGYFLDTSSPAAAGHAVQEASLGFVHDGPGEMAAGEASCGVETRETLEMVRAFNRIRDPEVRRRVFELTKALAAAEPGS